MKTTQKGFSVIEGLLVTIIVLLVAFIGYYVYHSQKQTDKTLNSAASTNQTASSSSGSSSEKTLLLKYSNLKFNYDVSKWKVEQNDSGNDPHCGPFDNAQMETSAMDYQLSFGIGQCGKGGATCVEIGTCTAENKLINIVNVSSTTTLYLVGVQTTDKTTGAHDYSLWLTDDKSCDDTLCGISLKGFSDPALINGTFVNDSGDPPTDPGGLEQFVDLPQIEQAIAVLRTAHY